MNYYTFITFFTFFTISMGTAVVVSLAAAGIILVAIKPVTASRDNDFPGPIYRIDRISGVDKVIHFDSFDDCHVYVKHHSRLGLSFDDCIRD